MLVLLTLLGMVVVLVGGGAAPASAHASLVTSDPGEGAVLPTAPDRIRLTFSEDVTEVPGGVEVYDADGDAVDSATEVGGTDLDITLTDEVGEGTLVVVWRVVSRDRHPTSGSLTFSVGAPSEDVARPAVGPSGATDAPWALSTLRWIGYLGLFLAAGMVGFVVLFLPASHLVDRARGRLVRAAGAAAVLAAVAWVAVLPVSALYQLGRDVGALGDGSTWAALPTTEYAVTGAVVVGVLATVTLVRRRAAPAATLATGLVALAAPALTGHTRAATPEALAVGADMLHLLAGATWLGGLAALALVLPDLAGRGTMGAEVLARFSVAAAGVLAVLVATGSLLAWRILGSWGGLVETSYGRLLLVKVAVAAVVVGLAAWNRYRLVPGLRDVERRRDRRTGAGLVVRTITAEALVLLGVLLVTGLLVDRSPEPDLGVAAGLDTSRPVVRTADLGGIGLRATLSTQSTGANTVTLELLDDDGAPTEGFEPPRANVSSDVVDLGALAVTSVAPGVYEAEVVLPSPGTWDLRVSLRTAVEQTPPETPTATVRFSVAGGAAPVG